MSHFYTLNQYALNPIMKKINVSNPSASKSLDYKMKIEKDMLVASIDVPGVDIKDISVEVQDRYLTIVAPRDGQKQTSSFCINADFDINLAEARLNSGVLKIFCPRRTSLTKKMIPISHG